MKIQKLSQEFIPQVATLLRESWLEHAEKTRSYSREEIEARNLNEWLTDRVLTKASYHVEIALSDKEVIGLVLYRIEENMGIAPRKQSLKIEDIIVQGDCRGRGIAKQLLDHIESIALERGITEVSGDIYQFNDASRGLFGSAGYQQEYANYMKVLSSDPETLISSEEEGSMQVLEKVKLYTDGGSRGNPGPSAGGYVILDLEDNVVKSNGKYLGITTNNQAEYHSLKGGLEMAIQLGAKEVDVYMDSLLVINQMKGIFKIRNRDLWPIHDAIKSLLPKFKKVTFTHVPRELNKLADAEVNKTLDAQG